MRTHRKMRAHGKVDKYLIAHSEKSKAVMLDVVRKRALRGKNPQDNKQTAIIDLSEESLPIVRKLIEYCYTKTYVIKDKAVMGANNIMVETPDPPAVVTLDLHGQMFSIAKRYGVSSLEQLAASRFQSLSEALAKSSMWSRVPFEKLVAMVPEIEKGAFQGDKKTYQSLVDIIAEKITENMNLLNDAGLRDMFRKYPWFASDIRECRSGRRTECYPAISL
ncbi:MAG: hypothetical protein Q9168_004267 [Polycauliona sp. 1 TL-2023]